MANLGLGLTLSGINGGNGCGQDSNRSNGGGENVMK